MTKRYGFGEYERKDVEVPNSTWEMRDHFLNLLKDCRFDLFRQLLLPSGMDGQWLKDLDHNNPRLADYLLIARAFGKDFEKGDVRLGPIDSTFGLFLKHLDSKPEELARCSEEVRFEPYRFSEKKIRAEAIKRVVGTWEELQNEDSATSLSKSLRDWSIKNNLSESWVVEFVLMLFKNLKASLDPWMATLQFVSWDDAKNMNERFICAEGVRQAIGETIMEHHSLRVMKNLWEFPEDLPDLPRLEFKYEELVLPPCSWSFYTEGRKEFSDRVLGEFDSISGALKDLNDYPSINLEAYREGVNSYCEIVKETVNNAGLQREKSHTIWVHPNLMLHSATWNPATQPQPAFVTDYLVGLKNGFEQFKRMAKSIDTKTRGQLDAEIYAYCNKIETRKPATYKRTPRKHTDNKHFMWLINFQVPPVRTYQEIAASYSRSDSITDSGVEKAVKRLAKAIGIKLRRSPRTGRPQGVREVKPRRRVQ